MTTRRRRRLATFDLVGLWLIDVLLHHVIMVLLGWPLWVWMWRQVFPASYQPPLPAKNDARWKAARVECFRRHKQANGGILKCVICGRSPEIHGVAIDCAHIKSRSKWPELAYDQDNLVPQCTDCNRPSGNNFMSLAWDYCVRKYGRQ